MTESAIGERMVGKVAAMMAELAAWTEAQLVSAALTLPDGADLRTRLLVRDHNEGGRLVRREVVLDGAVYATALVSVPSPAALV